MHGKTGSRRRDKCELRKTASKSRFLFANKGGAPELIAPIVTDDACGQRCGAIVMEWMHVRNDVLLGRDGISQFRR